MFKVHSTYIWGHPLFYIQYCSYDIKLRIFNDGMDKKYGNSIEWVQTYVIYIHIYIEKRKKITLLVFRDDLNIFNCLLVWTKGHSQKYNCNVLNWSCIQVKQQNYKPRNLQKITMQQKLVPTNSNNIPQYFLYAVVQSTSDYNINYNSVE